jgi:hypothetical protein
VVGGCRQSGEDGKSLTTKAMPAIVGRKAVVAINSL